MIPTISVIIPTYNGAAWIAETLDSVFRQTQVPIEIIVVDDASTDGTAESVAALAADASVPIRIIEQPVNSGSPAPTLNVGMAQATGELIAVLDQDDLFLPSKLESQARALSEHPEMSLVFSLFANYEQGTKRRGRSAAARVRHIRRRMARQNDLYLCDGPVALEEFARSINFVGGFPGFMFRRSAWLAKGGFDEHLRIAADYEFLCWLCTRGSVGFIPEIHYLRREHDTNLTRRTGVHWRLDAINVLLKYADHASTPAIPAIVRTTIHHHLWAVARRLASAGHQRSAGEVYAIVSQMVGGGWRALVQRLAIPAYVGFYRIFRQPWKIAADQADAAVRLSQAVALRLSSQ
ncbi:MAG: glycosyltransferase [Gammaproteobacteria bacterium]|nr:glycosyltransferase [Gammaproteobacteria bacterium]NNL50925.1 glycosyltransferase [Woeseiaceae bacterium]